MKNLIENSQIVEAIAPQAGGGALAGDYISLKKAGHVTVLVQVNQGNAAPVPITIEQAKDVAGTDTKALAAEVPVFLVADAAASDLWVRQADAVSFTTGDTLTHKLVALEIDAEDLDVVNGFTAICVKAGASNAANIVAAQYIATKLRYGLASLIVD